MAPRAQEAFIFKWNLALLRSGGPTDVWWHPSVATKGRKWGATWPGGSGPAPPLTVYVYVPVCPSTLYLLGRPSPISVETQKCLWVWPPITSSPNRSHRRHSPIPVSLIYRSQQADPDKASGQDPALCPARHTAGSRTVQRTPKCTRLQGQHKATAKTPRSLRPLVRYPRKGGQQPLEHLHPPVIAPRGSQWPARFPRGVQTPWRGFCTGWSPPARGALRVSAEEKSLSFITYLPKDNVWEPRLL